MNNSKNIQIFIRTAILSSLLFATSSLLYITTQTLIKVQLAPTLMPFLKIVSIFPVMILAIVYLAFSRSVSFEKLFKRSLIYIGCAIAISFTFVLLQNHFSFQMINPLLEKILPAAFKSLVSHKAIVLFEMITVLARFNLFSIFIWGFINQITSRFDAYKLYMPLACILGFVATLTSSLLTPLMRLAKTGHFSVTVGIALAFLVAAYVVFQRSFEILSKESEEQSAELINIRFPILSSAYLLVGAIAAGSFTHILFRSSLKTLFSNPTNYMHFIGKFSSITGTLVMILTLFWAIFGTWMLINKGWKKTLNYGVISIFVGGLAFLALSNLGSTGLLIGQSISRSILVSTTSFLFFPLIQIFYLYLPKEVRFAKKVAVEMVALPLIKVSSSFIIQLLVIAFGSLSACRPYLMILFAFFLGIIYLASRSLRSHFPASEQVGSLRGHR